MLKKITATVCIISTLLISGFTQADQEAEIQKYIEIFKGPAMGAKLDAANELQYTGISDTRIFDLIEAELNATYATAADKPSIHHAAWYAKALAFSGQEKYRPTLKNILNNAKHPKLRKHVQKTFPLLQQYAKWNPIIADTRHFKADEPDQINRFVNMIKSSEWELKRIAAKRVFHENLNNTYLLDTISEELLKHHKTVPNDGQQIDTLQCFAKALGAAGSHREELQKASMEAPNPKLRIYIIKVLRKYFR